MSRTMWRCHAPGCTAATGSSLGRITQDDGLILDPRVRGFSAYLDTRRVFVVCPDCGTKREFRGRSIMRND